MYQCANWNTWGPMAASAKKVKILYEILIHHCTALLPLHQVFCLTDTDIANLARYLA